MSRIEDFDSEYWSDPAIEPLSLDASHLYIWTWTNDRIGTAGLYKATRTAMLAESKVPPDRLDAALAELEEHQLAFYDGTYMWVKARVKRLRTRTVAMCRGIAKAVAKVPADHPYRVQFMERYGAQSWRSGNVVTTLAMEVSALDGDTSPDTPGSHPFPPFPKPKSQSYTGESSTHKGKGNGYGTGKGKGNGKELDARARARDWARTHLPDLPEDQVAVAVTMLVHAGRELDPEDVRRRVLARYPFLAEEAA